MGLAASGSGADSAELARVLIDARADVNLQTLPGDSALAFQVLVEY
jgi:sulfate adenylyltransferase subunit 1 (EFTu-like GTPase family)